jgi:hypothetical protein
MLLLFIISLVILNMIVIIGINPITGGEGLLDLRMGYTITDVENLFTLLGPEGRTYYLYQKVADAVFPISYGFGIALLITYGLKLRSAYRGYLKFLTLFPIIGMIFDYIENILHISQILSFPNLSSFIISIASYATLVKFSFLIVGIIVMVILGILILVKRE